MPTSVLTTRLPPQMTELSAGASGRLPLTLVHVLPTCWVARSNPEGCPGPYTGSTGSPDSDWRPMKPTAA